MFYYGLSTVTHIFNNLLLSATSVISFFTDYQFVISDVSYVLIDFLFALLPVYFALQLVNWVGALFPG